MRFMHEIITLTSATKKTKGVWQGKCPAHNDSDPSFTITEVTNEENPLVFCHAGCSQKEVVTALKDRGLWHVRTPIIGEKVASFANKAMPVFEFSNYEKYLNSRNIYMPELEFCGSLSFHEETSRNESCLAFPLKNKHNDIMGFQRIFIDEEGKKLDVDAQKKVVGDLMGNFYKMGDQDDLTVLCVAEGIETAMSIYKELRVPTWATVSASNMINIQVPVHTKVVHIFSDLDTSGTGQAKAVELANLLLSRCIEVYIHYPKTVDTDFNDTENCELIKNKFFNDDPYYFCSLNEALQCELRKDQPFPQVDKKLSSWLYEVAYKSEVKESMVAMPLFSAASTLLANKYKVVSPIDGYHYTPTFWSCIIANPSARKSTAVNKGVSGLKTLMKNHNDSAANYLNAVMPEIKALEFDIKKTKKLIDKSDSVDVGLTEKLINLEKKLDEVKTPGKKKNYIVNNTTIEALLKELSINPGSTLLHTDELAEWLGMMEHSYQTHARATYLSLFSGIKDWNHKRVTGTDIEIQFGHVNIVGTTQPDVIFPKISDSKSDGLIQRFQGMVYSSASCNIEPVYGNADKKLLDEMDKFFIYLSTLENGNIEFDSNGKVVCHEMEEHKRAEMLQAEKDSKNSLASHLGKIDTTFATLCLFFEAYDCFNSSKNLKKITRESAVKAMEVCKYLMDGYKYIYTIANGNKSDLLKKIASAINDGVFGEIIIPSELHNYNYRRSKREYFNAVIDELENCKFIFRVNENRYYRPKKKAVN